MGSFELIDDMQRPRVQLITSERATELIEAVLPADTHRRKEAISAVLRLKAIRFSAFRLSKHAILRYNPFKEPPCTSSPS